jgi:hypothetical protein
MGYSYVEYTALQLKKFQIGSIQSIENRDRNKTNGVRDFSNAVFISYSCASVLEALAISGVAAAAIAARTKRLVVAATTAVTTATA